ncbi:MAG: hypothetical protein AABW73_03415 [Nanoarchaeota archaeon]
MHSLESLREIRFMSYSLGVDAYACNQPREPVIRKNRVNTEPVYTSKSQISSPITHHSGDDEVIGRLVYDLETRQLRFEPANKKELSDKIE